LGGTSRQPTLEHVPNHRKCRQAAGGLGRTCRQRLCKIISATRAKKVRPFGDLSTSSEPQVASRRTPIIEVAGPLTEAPHYKRRACRFSTVKFAKCLPVSAGHTYPTAAPECAHRHAKIIAGCTHLVCRSLSVGPLALTSP
jgi:hypothetical protein